MNKKNSILLVLIGIIVTGFTLGVIWWQMQPKQPQKYTGPVEKIRLGVPSLGLEIAGLIWIAENQGYFTEQGLDVVITTPSSSLELQQGLSEGKLDFVVASDFSFITNILGNNPMKAKVLATIDKANWFDVVARKDRGISKPADLKGKKIAVFKNTALEFFLGNFLTYNNVALEDVELVDIPTNKFLDAITSGEVDAVVINDPFTYEVKNLLAENAVSLYAAEVYGIYNYLVFGSDEFIKNHPKTIERYLQALLQAEDYVENYPNESQEILAKKFNQEKSRVSSNWGKHKYYLSLDQSLFLMMEDQSRWRIANKLTDKTVVPNYFYFVYVDALELVKPEAVSIIH